MSLLLGFSLFINVLLIVGLALAAWRQPEAARSLFRAGQDQMQSFFEEYRVEPGDIVFVGDSLTAGARWPEVFPGRPVRNRGIRGDTTSGLLERLDAIAGGRPALVLLMIGSNDLGFDESVEATLERYAEILDGVRARSPETRIVCQSVLPRQAEFADRIRELNAGIRTLAEGRGHHYADLFPSFANARGELRPEFTNDGLHLLGVGYALWAELIRDLVPGGPPSAAATLEYPGVRPGEAT